MTRPNQLPVRGTGGWGENATESCQEKNVLFAGNKKQRASAIDGRQAFSRYSTGRQFAYGLPPRWELWHPM